MYKCLKCGLEFPDWSGHQQDDYSCLERQLTNATTELDRIRQRIRVHEYAWLDLRNEYLHDPSQDKETIKWALDIFDFYRPKDSGVSESRKPRAMSKCPKCAPNGTIRGIIQCIRNQLAVVTAERDGLLRLVEEAKLLAQYSESMCMCFSLRKWRDELEAAKAEGERWEM